MRRDFEMTQEDMDRLMEAAKPIPMIMLQCGTPTSPQEKTNIVWMDMAEKMGFVWDSVTSGNRSSDYWFSAEEVEPER